MAPDEGTDGGLPPSLQASPLPTGLVDAAGEWTSANPALTALLGTPAPGLGELVPEAGPDVTTVLARPRASTLWIELPDGRPADALVAGSSGDGPGTRLVHLVDRSEVRRLREHAEAAATATAGFVARVSHDLKNPIGTALGYAELLLEDATLGDEARAFTERILSSTSRAIDILVEIVSETRASAAVRPPDEVDLTAVLDEVRADLGEFIAARGAVVEASLPLPTLRGDRRDLQRALAVLVRNSIQHHPGAAQVRVAAEPTADGWAIVVEDDGPGIALEDRETALAGQGAPDAHGHRGIGLALTRAAVARHGGRLELGDAPAGGLRVRLLLPQRRADDPPAQAP